MRRLSHIGQALALPLLLLTGWWVVSDSSTSLYFPPLRSIVDAFFDTWVFEDIGPVLVPTLQTFAIGFGISIVLGISIGLVLASNERVADFFSPLMEFLRALPGIALVPVFMSVLGVGASMRTSVVVFASIWPILLNTIDGVRGIDMVVRDTSSGFHVPFWPRLMFVVLPGASPQIVAGARVGMSLSLIAVIVTEMVTPAAGVGAFTKKAQMSFDLTAMWTAIILMGVVGYLLNLAFDQFEKRILRWHLQMQDVAAR